MGSSSRALVTRVQPSIIAESPSQLTYRLAHLSTDFQTFHLDVMVPPRVPNRSLIFDGADRMLSSFETDADYSVHVMANRPMEDYISKVSPGLLARIRSIIVPCEIGQEEFAKVAEYVRGRVMGLGLAMDPSTRLEEGLRFIELYHPDEVLVMGVPSGAEGQKISEDQLEIVDRLRKSRFKGIVGFDGGVNANTIGRIAEVRPDYVVSGSFVARAKSKIDAALYLQQRLDEWA